MGGIREPIGRHNESKVALAFMTVTSRWRTARNANWLLGFWQENEGRPKRTCFAPFDNQTLKLSEAEFPLFLCVLFPGLYGFDNCLACGGISRSAPISVRSPRPAAIKNVAMASMTTITKITP